ncbi:hypothetical protein KQI86_06925 [Clostridium sp. MSJ-11]|uniref:ABC transporter permease n=1 Tax=Clostridium mobile TaxID=2841512 RepID=A0ABS6EI29_9CLOT|nr:hypothetical protein [Clostridium mobile]MBU5484059.1 hypothetical protein [Clostridium mobile]
MRILNSVFYDIKFQIKHGFYSAYIVVSIFYIGILKYMPQIINKRVGTLIVFSDPSVLGALFMGGIFLLERDQNTLESLFVTPFRVEEYIISKVISLTIISVLSSGFIVFATYGFTINLIAFFLGVIITSSFYTLLGLIIVVYSKNLNNYLLNSCIITIFILPVVEYLSLYSTPIFYLLPGKASLQLINGAFFGISNLNFFYSIALLVSWSAITYLLAIRAFNRKVILKIGG